MAKYTIKIKNSAIKELEKLHSNDYDKVSRLIFSLADDPRPNGYKKLKDFKIESKEAYRLRQGNYRIIYTIEEDVLVIYVAKVGHRRDIYE